MEIFGIFALFIIVAIIIRLIAGSMDGDRVESYVRERGWKLVDKSWDPLGPGWFGEKNARIYQIAYEDQFGNIHKAHVKTSALSGVYLTKDTIVQHAKNSRNAAPAPMSEADRLRQENEELRRRLHELGES